MSSCEIEFNDEKNSLFVLNQQDIHEYVSNQWENYNNKLYLQNQSSSNIVDYLYRNHLFEHVFFLETNLSQKWKTEELQMTFCDHQKFVQTREYIAFDCMIFRRWIQHICCNFRRNIINRQTCFMCMTFETEHCEQLQKYFSINENWHVFFDEYNKKINKKNKKDIYRLLYVDNSIDFNSIWQKFQNKYNLMNARICLYLKNNLLSKKNKWCKI